MHSVPDVTAPPETPALLCMETQASPSEKAPPEVTMPRMSAPAEKLAQPYKKTLVGSQLTMLGMSTPPGIRA